MKVTISFLHLEHTPALDERIEEKSERLQKYLGKNSHVKWSCYIKNNLHYAELDLTGKGQDFHAAAHSDNLYKTLDIVVEKLEKQLKKRKDKLKNKLHRKSHLVLVQANERDVAVNSDTDNTYYDEEDWKDVG